MKKILIILLITPYICLSQSPIGEIKFQRRDNSFPFDSGISMSYNQYIFLQKQSNLNNISKRIEVDLSKPAIGQVKVVEIEVERKRQWHEKPFFQWTIRGLFLLGGYKLGRSL